MSNRDQALVLWFSEVGKQDAELVGGKGAKKGGSKRLGMIAKRRATVVVPPEVEKDWAGLASACLRSAAPSSPATARRA